MLIMLYTTSLWSLSPFPLHQGLKQPKPEGPVKDIGIVDVRDNDFSESKLPGAVHMPSGEWWNDDMVDQLVSCLRDREVVVFYCGATTQDSKESEVSNCPIYL